MKKVSRNIIFLILAICCIQSSWAQDVSACSSLIQQGIYDKYSESTGSSGYSQFISNFCGSYSTYSNNVGSQSLSTSGTTGSSSGNSGSSSVSASASILGWFGIGGGESSSSSNNQASANSAQYSGSSFDSQISSLGQFLCNGTSNTEAASNAAQIASDFIDPNALAAYEECLSQFAAGLQVSTTIREDQAQVTIEMNYVPPIGTQAYTNVTDIVISPPGSWECSGPLWNLIQDVEDPVSASFGTDSVAMSCTRNMSADPFIYQDQSLYAVSSSITIMTTSSAVIRNFVPIYATPTEGAISVATTTLTSEISEFNTTVTDSAPAALMSSISSLQSQIASLTLQYATLVNQFATLTQDLLTQNKTLLGLAASNCMDPMDKYVLEGGAPELVSINTMLGGL